MALPQITFIEGQGGLGRPLPNNDHISALLFYTNGTLPSGFATTSVATRCKAIYSPDDAVAAGIVKDYSDATAAACVYTFTNAGAAGDTVTITVTDLNQSTGATQTTSLGSYTRTSAATTVTLVAADIVTMINTGTSVHGYSATSSVGAVTLTAPKRLGAYLNTTSPTVTIVGTVAGTQTQAFGTGSGGATAGVNSRFTQYWYHISEFFRIQHKGKLWVGFFAVPGTYTWTEITDMQNNAAGEIRQIGIWADAKTWASGDLTTINTICETNKSYYQALQALYAANLQATTDITTVSDLNSLTAKNAQTVLGQDGGGQGNFIYRSLGAGIKSITCLGAQLGMIALRKVSENQGWVQYSNLSNGVELEIPAFCNGQLVSALSKSALDSLDSKRHVFLRKHTNVSGTYFNDSHVAIAANSDYAYMENNRTICKAERLIYAAVIPSLLSPISFNSNGTMTDTSVAFFENIASQALDQMVRDSELSAKKVTVNPSQNVVSTSKLVMAVQLVINGTARNIEIGIGFKPSIS